MGSLLRGAAPRLPPLLLTLLLAACAGTPPPPSEKDSGQAATTRPAGVGTGAEPGVQSPQATAPKAAGLPASQPPATKGGSAAAGVKTPPPTAAEAGATARGQAPNPAPVAARGLEGAGPSGPAADFGERALAKLSRRSLPGGLELLLWDCRGRSLATALLGFDRSSAGAREAQALDLALALFAREAAKSSADPLLRANLVELGSGPALLFEGRSLPLLGLLSTLADRLSAPAFLAAAYPESGFQSVLAELRLEALRGDGGKALAEEYFGLDLEAARQAWRASIGTAKPRLVLSADLRLLGGDAALAEASARPLPGLARPGLDSLAARVLLAEYLSSRGPASAARAWTVSKGDLEPGGGFAGISAPLPSPADLRLARARSLEDLFAPGAVLLAMAEDLGKGGDGSLPFRLATALRTCDLAALGGAARELGVSLR